MGLVRDIIKALVPPVPKPSAAAIADPEVLRLFLQIEELRRLDSALEVHGAHRHRYDYQPLTDDELASLESDLGVELPDQFRRWLSCVGTGAGPGYGLSCWIPDDAAPAPLLPLPANVIPDVGALTPELLRGFEAVRETQALGYLLCVASMKGLLRLCEHGCAWESLLILAGPFKGRVIDDIAAAIGPPDGAEAAFLPGSGLAADGLPTFFEWLQDWVDTAIEDLSRRR